jgi:hypothetical protein
MTDVVLCCYDYDHPIRKGMQMSCIWRWKMQEDANVIYINPAGIRNLGPFHIARKHAAERLTSSPIYVVADDDALPIGSSFVRDGVRILGEHPEYGMASARSISDGPIYPNEEIVESQCGGIVFVKKGILLDFEECDADKVDDTICREMNRRGYKTGVMPSVRFNHLGAGYSITSKGYWNKL